MQHKYKALAIGIIIVVGLAVVFFNQQSVSGQEKAAAPAAVQSAAAAKQAAAGQPTGEPWSVRCSGDKPTLDRECEVYQRLIVSKTGQRVAEFAVGFPKGKTDGRGVIVLPLGILLEEGIVMQIDEGQKFKFKPRYCTNDGCFAFVNVNAALLEELKKGSVVQLNAKALNGKEIKIKMSLQGFGKILKQAAEG
ncbi:MAG TPA: invasion associated locus B family protein [Micavibrio sp.]